MLWPHFYFMPCFYMYIPCFYHVCILWKMLCQKWRNKQATTTTLIEQCYIKNQLHDFYSHIYFLNIACESFFDSRTGYRLYVSFAPQSRCNDFAQMAPWIDPSELLRWHFKDKDHIFIFNTFEHHIVNSKHISNKNVFNGFRFPQNAIEACSSGLSCGSVGIYENATWTSCQILKISGCACAANAGNVFPSTAGRRSRHASRHVRHAFRNR